MDYMHINRQMAHLIIGSVSCSCTQTTYRGPSLTSIFPQLGALLVSPPSTPSPPNNKKLSTAWKTCLMFMVFECVDLADMLSLWCCNPVTNSVLYLLVGIYFLASVALNYNHFFIAVLCVLWAREQGAGDDGKRK